jgi:Ca-activated chloride channel family protein
MTFASPLRLLLLGAPVVLLGCYLWMQRRRHATALRFTSVDLLASVAPRRPGWQRHLASALLLSTIALLVVGFAQPAHTVRTPRQRATVILTIDVSGSMIANDVMPDRLTAAKAAAKTFVRALPSGVQLGLVSFSTNAQVDVAPTTDRTSVLSAIDVLQAAGGTATGDAIQLSLKAAASVAVAANSTKVPAAIVLMSDGKPSMSSGSASPSQAVDAAVTAAKTAGVKINTIAFGTDAGVVTIRGEPVAVPSDPAAMAAIASMTGGHTFTAKSASQLTSVYGEIGRTVGYLVHHQDITAWFTGLGLLTAALAAAAALVWSQRIA